MSYLTTLSTLQEIITDEIHDAVDLDYVPDSWWRVACERQCHPIACVSQNHTFVWCNEAWERLVGYSQKELTQKTWMDITKHSDIGGDLESAEDLITGTTLRYTMAKRYIHKLGHTVPVEITAYRFPHIGNFVCFIVEAVPEVVSQNQLQEMEKKVQETVKALMYRIQTMENHNKSSNHITIGGNDPKWIAAIVIGILGVVGYLIYIGGWHFHEGDAQPPSPPEINREK